MTKETLQLLRQLLVNQVLQVGAEDFLETATAAAKALQEIDEALQEVAR